MALAKAVQGATYTPQRITWIRGDGTALDLGAATSLTGVIRDGNGDERAITGQLVTIDGARGIFDWQYSASDVSAVGYFRVQFTATFGLKTERSIDSHWEVLPALV